MSEDLVTEVTEATEVTEESIAEPGQETDPVSALTADLQRLQAEYANYKKRVERDRSLAHELAISSVLIELLPVLDDIERAQTHGELTGGFKAVSDQIAATTVVTIVNAYLADHPEIFASPDRQRDLLDILDAFVRAGWTQARALVFRISDIWR